MGLSPYALQQAQSTRPNPSSAFTQQAQNSLTQGQRQQAPSLPNRTPTAPQRPITSSPIVDPNQRFPQTPSAPQRPVAPSSSSNSTTTTRSPRQTQFGTRQRVSEIQGAAPQAQADAERLQRARADYKATAITRNGLVWRKEHQGAPITAAIASQIRTAVDQADVGIYNGQIEQGDTTAQIAFVFEDVTNNYRRQIPQLVSEIQQIVQQQQSLSVASQSETTAEVHTPTTPRKKAQVETKTEHGVVRKVDVEIDDDSQQNADLPPFRRGTIPFVPSSETASSFNFRKPLFSPAAREISIPQQSSSKQAVLQELATAKSQLENALAEASTLLTPSAIRSQQTAILNNLNTIIQHVKDKN